MSRQIICSHCQLPILYEELLVTTTTTEPTADELLDWAKAVGYRLEKTEGLDTEWWTVYFHPNYQEVSAPTLREALAKAMKEQG